MDVRLEMLGGFRVLREGKVVKDLPHQKLYALLAFLALSPDKAHRREELITFLWPEADGEEGRQNLRQLLYTLRRELAQSPLSCPDLLLTTRTDLQIRPKTVQTDVAEFETVLQEAYRTNHLQTRLPLLAHAAALYTGELLPGFYQEDCLTARNRLAQAHLTALQDLARGYEQSGQVDAALRYAQQVIQADPLLEEAHCIIMRLHIAAGHPSAARRQFQELERILQTKVGGTPSELALLLWEQTNKTLPTNRTSLPPVTTGAAIETAPPITPAHSSPAPSISSRRQTFWAVLGIGAILLTGLSLQSFQHLSAGLPSITAPSKQHPLPQATIQIEKPKPSISRHSLSPESKAQSSEPIRARLPLPANRAGTLSRDFLVPSLNVRKTAAIPGRMKETPEANTHTPSAAAYTGKQRWIVTTEPRPSDAADGGSEPAAIATDRDGNIYVCGLVHTRDRDVDCVTLKFDSQGKVLWEKRYDGPAHDCERPASMALDAEGNVYVAGESYNREKKHGGTEWDVFLLKYSAQGKELWTKQYDGPEHLDEHAVKVAVAPSGRIAIGAYSERKPTFGDYLILQYAPNGDRLWVKTYNSREDNPVREGNARYLYSRLNDLTIDKKGNIAVTGEADFYAPDGIKIVRQGTTLLFDPEGKRLEKWGFDSLTGASAAVLIACDDNNSIYTAAKATIEDHTNTTPGERFLTCKFGKGGWETAYAKFSEEIVKGIAVDNKGRMFITGIVRNPSRRSWYSLTACYNSATGQELWAQPYKGYTYRDATPHSLAVDSEGNVLVAGIKNVAVDRAEGSWFTVKYSPEGKELWHQSYATPGSKIGEGAVAVTSDATGNVYVAGFVERQGCFRIALIKYAP